MSTAVPGRQGALREEKGVCWSPVRDCSAHTSQRLCSQNDHSYVDEGVEVIIFCLGLTLAVPISLQGFSFLKFFHFCYLSCSNFGGCSCGLLLFTMQAERGYQPANLALQCGAFPHATRSCGWRRAAEDAAVPPGPRELAAAVSLAARLCWGDRPRPQMTTEECPRHLDKETLAQVFPYTTVGEIIFHLASVGNDT